MKLLLVLAVMAMFLTACSTDENKENIKEAREVTDAYRMYEWPKETTFELEMGTPKRFIVGENASTGFMWQVEGDETKCKVILERLPAAKEDEMLCGAPGEVLVTLEPVAPGESDVVMRYMRSWEPDDPAHVMKIHLNIK